MKFLTTTKSVSVICLLKPSPHLLPVTLEINIAGAQKHFALSLADFGFLCVCVHVFVRLYVLACVCLCVFALAQPLSMPLSVSLCLFCVVCLFKFLLNVSNILRSAHPSILPAGVQLLSSFLSCRLSSS